jgi:SAM-dependent methyltransferase
MSVILSVEGSLSLGVARGKVKKPHTMGDQADSYNVSAKYYDAAYAAKKDLVDIPFYVDLAQRLGGPVLEIACGTGRVLLNIGRAGLEIVGVDQSKAMLNVFETQLQREPSEVRSRVSVYEGDMRRFRLGRKFPLVIIPFRPMQHMLTLKDQIAALTTASAHLQENGRLAFDVFFPLFDRIPTGIREEMLELEWTLDSQPATTVRRYFRKESFDKVGQTFSATFIYRTYQGGTLVREETEPLKMSYYTYPHLRGLFLLTGLEPVEEYGSFDKAPLDNSSTEMIFVLKKAPTIS